MSIAFYTFLILTKIDPLIMPISKTLNLLVVLIHLSTSLTHPTIHCVISK